MGQIIGSAAKPKRCNLNKLSQLGIPAAGEYILVSSDNSMNAAGQGNFDCYIVGNGRDAATALKLNLVDISPNVGDWDKLKKLYATNWINGSLNDGLDYIADSTRNISTLNLTGLEGKSLVYTSESGYQLSIRFVRMYAYPDAESINLSSSDVISQIGWVGSGHIIIPAGTRSAVIIERKSNNANISVSESEKVSFSIDDYTMTKAINDIEESLPSENMAKLDVHNYINGSLDANFAYIYDARRLIGTLDLDGMSGFTFLCAVQSGYKLSIRFVTHKQFEDPINIAVSSSEIIASYGWITSTQVMIPQETRSVIIILARTNDANIPVSDADKADFSVIYDNLNERISVIEARALSKDLGREYSGFYSGDFLPIGNHKHPFNLSLWKEIGLPYYAQSIAIYGDYFVCFYGNNTSSGSLWKLSNATKIADITFGYGSFSKPHGNVMNFGNEFADGNTDLPLLYVSQWDGEGGCLVYDIRLDGTCTLVQTIMVSNMTQDKFGSALGDWVIDNATNSIYSVKYHNNSATPSATNYDNVCRFALPKLVDGSAIVLTDSDILESFTMPFTPIGQDKKISNGMMFIAAGNPSYTDSQKIYAVDLGRKAMVSIFNLASYGDEPEGLEILDDGLILGYGYQPQKFFLITTVSQN